MFSRSNPRSLAHSSISRTCCAVLSCAVSCALIAGFTLALTKVKPILKQLQDGSPALAQFFEPLRPDFRVLVHENATLSVNRALPYSLTLGGPLGGRLLLDRPSLTSNEVRQRLTSGSKPDWVVSGRRVALRGATTPAVDREEGEIVTTEHLSLADSRFEFAAAVFCEAMSSHALTKTLAIEQSLKQRAFAEGDADAQEELKTFRYYNRAGMINAAHAAGYDDVVTHRVASLLRRIFLESDSLKPLMDILGNADTPDTENSDSASPRDDDDMSIYTASYVCTRESAGAAVDALRTHPLLSRTRPELILFATYFMSVITMVDICDLLYWFIVVGTFSSYVVMLLSWAAGMAKGEPHWSHVARVAAYTALPCLFYFKVVQLWLPEASGSGALSHPLSFFAALRIDTRTGQVIVHTMATMLLCVHSYDDAPGGALYLVVARRRDEQPGPPVAAAAAVAAPAAPVAAPAAAVAAPAAIATAQDRNPADRSTQSPSESGHSSEQSQRRTNEEGDSDDSDDEFRRSWNFVHKETEQLGVRLPVDATFESWALPSVMPCDGRSNALMPNATLMPMTVTSPCVSFNELPSLITALSAEIDIVSALADNVAQLAHYESLLASHEEYLQTLLDA